MRKFKCIKSLYRSIYNKNAFIKNRIYKFDSEDEKFIFIKDETDHAFNFVKLEEKIFYSIEEYFIEI